ncbi:MAG TPA: hypothetical protein VEX41_03815 [Candidatus Eisenbacteria bacterium]|nr:hypothetical protein [Candidatus Eisenbacteria bacterium]
MSRKWSISPGQLEESFTRLARLQAELLTKERAIGRRVQRLAKGLADLMGPGAHLYRRSVGLHAFDVDGSVCLAAAYLDAEADHYRCRYAVLCGGEVAVRALRTAALDPGDSDEPGPGRRVALAKYEDYEAFIDRLPIFLFDVTRRKKEQVQRAEAAGTEVTKARRRLSALARRQLP